MSIRGNLESFSLGEIFQSLSMNQHTGTLRVTDGVSEKKIYFSRGEICLLSTGPRETTKLGDYLIKNHIAEPQQIQNALKQQKDSGKLLGEILLEMKVINQDQLREALRYKIEEEIYELFLWEKADFEFISNVQLPDLEDPLAKATKLALNTNSLLMESLRRIDEWQRIHQSIPGFHAVFMQRNTNPTVLERIDLPESHKAELTLIDGSRSIDDLLKITRLNKFELCKLLYEFDRFGVISLRSKLDYVKLADVALQSKNWTDAEKFYRNALDKAPDDTNLRMVFANLLKGHKKYREAFEEYRTLSTFYITKQKFDMGITVLKMALDIEPRNVEVLEDLFKALERGDLIDEAVKVAENLGRIHKQELNFHQAIEHYQKLIAWAPDNLEYFNLLAECYRSLNQKEHAARYYETIAQKQFEKEDYIEASKTYKVILTLDPTRKDIRGKLAETNRAQRKKEKALSRTLMIAGIILLALIILVVGADITRAQMKFSEALAQKDKRLDEKDFDFLRHLYNSSRPFIFFLPPAGSIDEEVGKVDKAEEDYKADLKKKDREADEFIDKQLAIGGKAERDKDYVKAYEAYWWVYSKYPEKEKAKKILFPMLVASVPQGAKVLLSSEEVGVTPILVRYPPGEHLKVHLELEGYKGHSVLVEMGKFQNLKPVLTRSPLWKVDLYQPLSAPPMLYRDAVYGAMANGSVISFDLTSGKKRWMTDLGGDGKRSNFTEFSQCGSHLFLGRSTGGVVKITTGGSVIKNGVASTDRYEVPPVVLAGRPNLMFLAGDGVGSFMRVYDGALDTSFTYKGKVTGRPVSSSSMVCFGTLGNSIYGREYGSDEFRFDIKTDSPVRVGGVTDNRFYYAASYRGTIYAVYLSTGTLMWEARIPGQVTSAPVLDENLIYITDDEGNVLALDKDTSMEAWSVELSGKKGPRAVALGREGLYVASRTALRVLDVNNGDELWHRTFDENMLPFVSVNSGRILLASESGAIILLWEKE